MMQLSNLDAIKMNLLLHLHVITPKLKDAKSTINLEDVLDVVAIMDF